MTLLRSADVASFLARPDPARAVVFVFGPDAGLVSERVDALIAASIDDPNDSLAVVRMPGDEIAADPAKLVDEAQAIPMFGGRRAIRVRAAGRSFIPALETLLSIGVKETRVVIEAGDLRKNAPLRVFAERERGIVAIACYEDKVEDVARLIDDELRAADLRIARDARATLIGLLGEDRRASRNELRKLAAYARGRDVVSLDDVIAVVSDAAALAVDGIVDAALTGKPAEVETQFARAITAGTSPDFIVQNALRHAVTLHKYALDAAAGTSIAEIGKRVFFRRQAAVEAALRAYSPTRALAVMQDLDAVARELRSLREQSRALDESIARIALLALAREARSRGAP